MTVYTLVWDPKLIGVTTCETFLFKLMGTENDKLCNIYLSPSIPGDG
jgi:hypothetical protein